MKKLTKLQLEYFDLIKKDLYLSSKELIAIEAEIGTMNAAELRKCISIVSEPIPFRINHHGQTNEKG